MRHTREELIERTTREFAVLDQLVSGLSDADWARPLQRAAAADPWTVKDALVHITYWKADVARFARGQRRPPDVRGLRTKEHNHVVYTRWRDRSPQDVVAWHKEVQEDVLTALREAPETWFNGRERNPQWPIDLDVHSAAHRVRDIDRVLGGTNRRAGGSTLRPARR